MSSRRAFDAARGRWTRLTFLTFGALLLAVAAAARAQAPAPAPGASPETAPSASPTPDPASAFQTIGTEVAKIFAKCKGAVVQIEATDRLGTNVGTGFFIDPSGTIYTHYSVVGGRSWNVIVEFAGKKYPATCLVADPRSGVALLDIKAGQTPFLPIGKSTDLKMATPVIAIGYPIDLPISPTFGLVAGFDQKFVGQPLPLTHIRANVPVQSGEQGAPLLNTQGEVVGIVSYSYNFGAVCLSIPIHAAEKVRAEYLRFGMVRPGWLGITAKPTGGDGEDEDGVRVDELADESPAAKCGLLEGDKILRVGGKPIHKFADLRDASFYMTANEVVPITVRRGDQEMTVAPRAADPPGTVLTAPPLIKSIDDNSTKLALPFTH